MSSLPSICFLLISLSIISTKKIIKIINLPYHDLPVIQRNKKSLLVSTDINVLDRSVLLRVIYLHDGLKHEGKREFQVVAQSRILHTINVRILLSYFPLPDHKDLNRTIFITHKHVVILKAKSVLNIC